MFSSRLPRDDGELAPNPLSEALDACHRAGDRITDLTSSNPTAVDLPGERAHRDAIAEALADGGQTSYKPHPRGLLSARRAVCDYYQTEHELTIDPAQVVLTASTSESYGFLFKLLCDPGDEVLCPSPSYPLFEHLATLEAVRVRTYPVGTVPRFDDRTRAVIVVSPNNPTGHMLDPEGLDALDDAAARAGAAIIGDEVFADYVSTPPPGGRASTATATRALTVTLSGLSKAGGMPHLKLGWMIVGGPPTLRERALTRLDHIADTYLSVASPVQAALPLLLPIAAERRRAIRTRLSQSRHTLAAFGFDTVLPPAGWSALLRLPPGVDDEDTAVALLAEDRVLVQPGYLFDIPPDDGREHLVLSMLSPLDALVGGLFYLRLRLFGRAPIPTIRTSPAAAALSARWPRP
ncbi:pyridoxal phosphate-dependent aminotransferase [Haliangium sp.]|uniref:pyridoxal phosphate-dependent aminotransferase n=1 Tax=Haliangium sp. TaxID=2663208 RepID=UPI003D0D3D6A